MHERMNQDGHKLDTRLELRKHYANYICETRGTKEKMLEDEKALQ
jgi:hypothetical protein